MYRRLLLIVLLGLLTTACVPYEGDGYYRSEVYTADRYSYPGYSPYYAPYNRGYYVAPSPRYYAPPPHYYYRPMPGPGYNRYYPGRGPDPRYRHGPYGQGWDRDRNHDGFRDRNHDGFRDRGHDGHRDRGHDGDRDRNHDGNRDRNWNR